MRFTTNVPKIGEPKDYINKPFNDENGNKIGRIANCVEGENRFELLIEADLTIPNKLISFDVKLKELDNSEVWENML